ncbi:MAG: hypothetical protein ACI8RZ_002900 [Myxococcota bacterium]|jgi:uncharacterized protein (DUF2252 family)
MLLLVLTGCSSQTASPRALWLRQALVNENTYWLARNPVGLADKYDAMAEDQYDYMRGSAGTWYADISRISSERITTDMLDDTEPVLLVGDAHPENLSTTIPGRFLSPTHTDPIPEITLEIIDLDAAIYGPWLLDLRRSATSLRVEAAPLSSCEADCIEDAIEELVAGYIDGALGDAPPIVPGSIIENLLAETIDEGQAREKYRENTADTIFADLKLRYDLELDDSGVGVLVLTGEEQAQIDRLMAQYDGPAGFRVLDAVRRFGTGISSRAAVRYLVLWDLGDDTTDADNGILTVRETIDPPIIPGLFAETGDRYPDNAQRIEAVSALLWSDPEADAAAAGMTDGELAFKVLTWSSWFQDADHTDVIEDWEDGDIDAGDFASMAGMLGYTLGSSHRRGETASGGSAVPVLEEGLDGREDDLLIEILEASESDWLDHRQDHAIFRDLLDTHGPLLGAEQRAEDVP